MTEPYATLICSPEPHHAGEHGTQKKCGECDCDVYIGQAGQQFVEQHEDAGLRFLCLDCAIKLRLPILRAETVPGAIEEAQAHFRQN